MFVFRYFRNAMRAISQGFLMIFRYVFIRSYATKVGSARRRLRSKTDMELKSRENPIVTTLDTPEFKKIFTPEVIDLKKIFDKYQHEIRIAGGAVRDLLMGQEPKDIDFATTATPTQMKEMFTVENIRMINMSGEKHGTITPRINDKENFEVTTLRIDMVTDGRHAEVEYTTDWKLDANRRDLTINSMFLGFNGDVYDYFFGYEDLQKRRVAFVGDADVRVKEDYLRIMRYFRFYGRIAEEPNNHEVETLKIIRNNVDGLENISGERICMELKKTLQGNYAGDLLKTMLETGVGQYIGLPASPDMRELERVAAHARLGLHPVCYLAALLQHLDQAVLLHARLKFSVFDRDLAFFLLEHRRTVDQDLDRPMRPYEKFVVFSKIKINDIKEYVRQLIKYRGEEEVLEKFNKWADELPRFPVGGKQLKESGVPSGRMYGKVISQLKEKWFESEYKLTAEDLVELIPDLIKEFDTGDKLKNDLEIKKRK